MADKIDQLNEGSRQLRLAAEVLEGDKPLEARDWKGFFSALAGFAAALLPLITPLFAEKKKQD